MVPCSLEIHFPETSGLLERIVKDSLYFQNRSQELPLKLSWQRVSENNNVSKNFAMGQNSYYI